MEARLVVIDPLMAYLDSTVNSWSDQHVRAAFAPLTALAERTGAAILILRHLNKATGMSALHRGGGSIGIVAAARSGLLVAKHPDNPEDERIWRPPRATLAHRCHRCATVSPHPTMMTTFPRWSGWVSVP